MIALSRRIVKALSLPVICGALALLTSVPALAVCHVSPGGSGACSSWADACSLQTALATSSCTEIWVEEGLYLPTGSTVSNPTIPEQLTSFDISPAVAVYGGFAGTESTRSQRDPVAHRTILSGDIDGNDAVDEDGVDTDATKIVGSNSFSVVVMDGTAGTPVTATTVLDGFTITGGDDTYNSGGGGLFCHGEGAGSECSPTLANLAFRGNRAKYSGGGLLDLGTHSGASSPTLTGVTFSGNDAGDSGGGMENNSYQGGTSSPTLMNVTFSNNTATNRGGGMVSYGTAGTSDPTLTNVTFSGNSCGETGGAIDTEANAGESSPVLTNVTMSGNSAGTDGGAFYVHGFNGGTSEPVLTNAILYGNSAGKLGPEIYASGASPAISHSVVEGGCASIAGASCGAGNLFGDPQLGPLEDNGGSVDTMALGGGSSAIDGGDDDVCPATDARGAARPFAAHCDIGAYEAGALAPGACSPGAHTLCIDDQPGDKRYRVTVTYHTTLGGRDGLSRPGNMIPLSSLGVTRGGLVWFFNQKNPEMLIKIINGSNVNNHRWVFYSAGTSVGLTVEVEDTDTGAIVVYGNADQHPAPPVLDTAAFTQQGQVGNLYQQVDKTFDYERHFSAGPGNAPACATNAAALCIGGRFLVQVDYHTAKGGGDGMSHPGTAIPLSSLGVDRGGLYWFFNSTNPEMLIKVLDACQTSGHFWVFYSAGTSVGLETTVEDTMTHMVNTYTNDDWSQAPPLLDTHAFPCP